MHKVEEFYYPCSEKKGADQLRSSHAADLQLCFRIYAKNRFSHDSTQEILFIIKMGFMAIFQIQELLNGHVHIRDKEYVGKVLEKMIKDGPDKLQVGLFSFLCF